MTLLTWDDVDDRYYEAGLDHGVLYPESGPGVAWSGLGSVVDKSLGGDNTSYYFEDRKLLDLVSASTFQATVSAYSYPIEFNNCIGDVSPIPGFTLTRQLRTRFGLSYRTGINDGSDYKIHLIYNALAAPSKRDFSAIASTPNPTLFEWFIDAVPVPVSGYKPSAHYILDTRFLMPSVIAAIEDILYGADGDPRLPTTDELISLAASSRTVIVLPSSTTRLPYYAIDGDLVLTTDDSEVYSVGPDYSSLIRPVIVIDDVSDIPSTVIAGDLVYNETTGEMYRIGDPYDD